MTTGPPDQSARGSPYGLITLLRSRIRAVGVVVAVLSLVVVIVIALLRFLVGLGAYERASNFGSTPEYYVWSLTLASTIVLSLILGWINWSRVRSRFADQGKSIFLLSTIYVVVALIATATYAEENLDPRVPLAYASVKLQVAVFVTILGAGPVVVGLWLMWDRVLVARSAAHSNLDARSHLESAKTALESIQNARESTKPDATKDIIDAARQAIEAAQKALEALIDRRPEILARREAVAKGKRNVLANSSVNLDQADMAVGEAREAIMAAETGIEVYESQPVNSLVIQEVLDSYTLLRSGLSSVSAIIVAAILSTGALRVALGADNDPRSVPFPESYIYLYGAFFSVFFAVIFLPAFAVWRHEAQELVDLNYPIPKDARPSEEWTSGRKRMEAMLHLDTPVGVLLVSGLGIFAPLITSVVTALVS
jgi:hypothetical protein